MLSVNEASYAKMISIFVDMAVEAKKSKKAEGTKSRGTKKSTATILGKAIQDILKDEPNAYPMDGSGSLLSAADQLPILYGTDAVGEFTFIDLFAGIGGLRKGFESIGGQCVYTSEWDVAAVKTYKANFNDYHPVVGDIRDIDASTIPDFDVLLAGFPCQPFSIAGVSKKNSLGKEHGFKDATQGTLFFDVVRILEHCKPKAFLLENVKNLVSHDKGNTFKIIKGVLENELGYKLSTRIIDAAHFLPQHRERIYIVGFAEDTGFSLDDLKLPDKKAGPKLSSILHGLSGEEENEEPFFIDGVISPKYTLTDHLWKYLISYKEKHALKGNGFGFGIVGPNDVSRTLSARYHKDGSEILISQKGDNPRRLTPRECARLMGFDKGKARRFKIPVSDTQAYRQFGNSVAVPVVEAIAQLMKPHIEELVSLINVSRSY